MMKVLWFSVTPSMYASKKKGHNSGGWIESLEKIVRSSSEVELGVAFIHPDTDFKKEIDGVSYYPMNVPEKGVSTKLSQFSIKKENEILSACIKVIEDFNPDVIHIFGSEWGFGLLYKYTNKPIVIHIQGSIPAHNNAAYPPGYSFIDIALKKIMNPKSLLHLIGDRRYKKERALREEEILRNTKYFMGRTQWDYGLTRLYAPESTYFYCSEALRDSFIKATDYWKWEPRKKCILVTTGGGSFLKGYDVVLKTAKLLKEHNRIDFEWHLLGPTAQQLKLIESKEKIQAAEVNIKCYGVVGQERVREELVNADLYIHPSYIDNSPNSLCEAQYLGVPVVATYVGGIPSLIDQQESGVLIPANDPYTLAYQITDLFNDKTRRELISENGRRLALERHDPDKILLDLINVYKKISDEGK